MCREYINKEVPPVFVCYALGVGVLFGYFSWFFLGIFYGFPFGRRASQSVSAAASQSVG